MLHQGDLRSIIVTRNRLVHSISRAPTITLSTVANSLQIMVLRQSTDTRNIFPLPALGAKQKAGISKPRTASKARARFAMRKGCLKTVNSVLGVLNDMSQGRVGGWQQVISQESPRSATHILETVEEWVNCRVIVPVVDRNSLNDWCYNLQETPRVWIKPELLSLPPAEIAATVDFREHLTAASSIQYESAQGVLRSPQELFNVKFDKPHAGVQGNEYIELIHTLVSHNIAEVRDSPPRVTNGVFAVPKDGTQQRLIIDAKNANKMFVDPPRVSLPH